MQYLAIKDLFDFEKGSLQSTKCTPGEFNFITASADWKTHNSYDYEKEALIVAVAASGSLGRVHYVNGKFIASDLCFVLTQKSKKYPVDLEFYKLVFMIIKDDLVKSTATGSSKKAINKTNFGKYKIPYINIDQQKKIKTKYLNYLKLSQDILKNIDDQLILISSLRDQILGDAVSGKLTEDWRDASFLKDDEQKQTSYEKDTLSKDVVAPFKIPTTWGWIRQKKIAKVGTGATPLKSNLQYYKNGTVPWVTSSLTGQSFIKKTKEFITEKALDETNCKLYPKNSLVIAMYGQGKTRGQVSELLISASTNQACAVIIPNEIQNINHVRYLKIFHLYNYNEIRKLAWGGAQPNLNLTKIKNTLIPLPPIEEQKEIVKKTENLLNQLSIIEKQIEERKVMVEQLNYTILANSFKN